MGGVAGEEQAAVRIGSQTKLRIGVMPFSKIGPSLTRKPSAASRSWSSSQMRSSGQSSMSLVRRDLEVEPA